MKTKIFSRLAAVLLVLGSLLPTAVTVAKAESQRQTDLVIHKIKMTSLVGWPKEKNPDGTYTGDNNQNYNGEKINTITSYFGAGAEELDGVSFTYWKIAKKEDYKKLTENPQNYDTVAKVEAFLKNVEKKQTGTTTGKTSNKNGVKVEHLEDGYYWFVENTGSLIANGETLSSGAAVPFGLELPVYKADGSIIKELHVYPKNTTTKPKIDKNFSNEEKDAKLAGGANYDHYQKDKGHVSRTIGSEVTYHIKTEIPAGAQYQALRWEDTMTKGLTYKVGSLELQITAKSSKGSDNPNLNFKYLEDYSLTENQSGFALLFTPEGLEKVKAVVQATKNDKGQITHDGYPMTIELNYKAIVNSDAVVDQFDQNTVVFDYGNNPKAYKDPRDKSTKPKDKSITVSKAWAAQPAPSGVEVTYYLYQKGTTANEDKVVDSVILTKDYHHTFTNLDDSKEYYVKESAIGYIPEYTSAQGGTISIKNTKDDKNPDPLKPTSPAIVTHGKKFVKTSQEDERLQGAAFVVTNQKTGGKYLAIKADNEQNAEEKAYQEAEKKYQEEIKKATTDKPNTLEIEKAKKARDDAFKKARTAYQWVDDKEKAIKLTSNSKGQLELTGLAAGTYYLEELTAPIGFAKLQERVEFKLGFNSYNGHKDSSGQSLEDHIQYEKGTPDFGYAQRVINKKITIPQTGGIGTVIFTIAGLAIMIGSGYVMVRRHRNDKA
ncbi:TPA: isopeptide-forming domain-containing fimbrial protein [Streptococcus equi subsp. zooepidemicus]|uniref:pilin N-terminal domain-containing protein n=1 Tax=Streptococcus equi TaxID=1336 RepID=UPI001E3BB04D|nr:pilin N-terminal domain-containing protein [Streptococcus equi]UFR19183.1 isopeptide-forming domain-containing fimbrial protein [Streptococcus equi subsp. zooepidemicus]HEL0008359.1 isopeptide-forming domain-containing fimbrial protein [Streptococcus equi subsp. zooepidemicus]HEL0115520.1 isopeptide-forming domain-containing fimbrial protein [Streptococcus equi subsp. zooepidemicus]HEL0117510.1 isopeptide-forming domain-containing fimbrial protein [Streptococcus equi subsp. zooepidemicus]HE